MKRQAGWLAGQRVVRDCVWCVSTKRRAVAPLLPACPASSLGRPRAPLPAGVPNAPVIVRVDEPTPGQDPAFTVFFNHPNPDNLL